MWGWGMANCEIATGKSPKNSSSKSLHTQINAETRKKMGPFRPPVPQSFPADKSKTPQRKIKPHKKCHKNKTQKKNDKPNNLHCKAAKVSPKKQPHNPDQIRKKNKYI